MRNDAVYLRHILDAIRQIEEHMDGADRATFEQQRLLQDGVTRHTNSLKWW